MKSGLSVNEPPTNDIEDRDYTNPDQTMFGLKFLLRGLVVIDQSKSCAFATTILCLIMEYDHTLRVCLIKSCELLREIGLGHIGAVRMKNVDNKLTARQQTVCDKLACSQGDRCSVSLKQLNEPSSSPSDPMPMANVPSSID